MSERELQKCVLAAAKLLGWRTAHFRPAMTKRGWRTACQGDAQGWPDLVLVKRRVVFAELKAETGKLTGEQCAWINALRLAGQEVYVWTPEAWRSGKVEEVLRS